MEEGALPWASVGGALLQGSGAWGQGRPAGRRQFLWRDTQLSGFRANSWTTRNLGHEGGCRPGCFGV